MRKNQGIVNANTIFINNSNKSTGVSYIYTDRKDNNNFKIGRGCNQRGTNVALSVDSNLITSGTFSGTFLGVSPGTDGYDNGLKVEDFVINWASGSNQAVTVQASGAVGLTASFSNIEAWTSYELLYIVGSASTDLYLNHSIYWPGGIRPSLSNATGSRDILTFTTDGDSNIYGTVLFNFSASVG